MQQIARAVAASISVAAGTPQSAHAYVAAHAPRYETAFVQPLVVHVAPGNAKVRFRCVTPGCDFPPQDQPDAVTRVDPRTFDVAGNGGTATITLTISTPAPQTVIVVAQAVRGAGPRAQFSLTAR